MKFMRQVGEGEATLDSKKEGSTAEESGAGSAASSWAREFASTWGEDELSSESPKPSSWGEEFAKRFGGKLLLNLCIVFFQIQSPFP